MTLERRSLLMCGAGLAAGLGASTAEAAAARDIGGFVAGLRQDEAAVPGAIDEPWSNGAVVGQVNRLKMIKRSMYDRAGLDLLRQRVLYPA